MCVEDVQQPEDELQPGLWSHRYAGYPELATVEHKPSKELRLPPLVYPVDKMKLLVQRPESECMHWRNETSQD